MAAGGENHAWTTPGIGCDWFLPQRGNCSNCNFPSRGILVTATSSPRHLPTHELRPRSQRQPDTTHMRRHPAAELNVCLARSFDITCTHKVQSIIHQVQAALGGNVGWFIGLVLLGLLALYLATLCYGTFRRLYFERERRSLARVRLLEEIRVAKLRCQEVEQIKLFWNGYRKFQVTKKVRECEGVDSFYLAPHDGRPLPIFKPGQYITFQLNIPGEDKP